MALGTCFLLGGLGFEKLGLGGPLFKGDSVRFRRESKSIMAELKDRYDRQIRVWGIEAQKRIQGSRVLVVGLQGLNVEAAKNIVLAGMNVTVQDDTKVLAEDLSFNFFLSPDDVGKSTVEAALPRIHQLNTHTSVEIERRPIKSLDAAFFEPFTVVLMSAKHTTQEEVLRVNSICRASSSSSDKKVFFLSDVFGDESWFVSDFGHEFEYQPDKRPKKEAIGGGGGGSGGKGGGEDVMIITDDKLASQEEDVTVKTESISFPSLHAVFGKVWSELPSRHFPLSKTFLKARLLMLYRDIHGGASPAPQNCESFKTWAAEALAQNNLDISSTFPPGELDEFCRTASSVPVVTCSTMGSFLAQEVIKGVSLSGKPGFNVWVFNCKDYQVRAMPIAN